MIKRYEVRWKSGGVSFKAVHSENSFFTLKGAQDYAIKMNNFARDYDVMSGNLNAVVVAIVWDRQLDTQVRV